MVPSATDAWRNALRSLREEVPEQTIRNWMAPIAPLSLDAESGAATLTLGVPNSFCAQYLQSRFNREIGEAVSQAVGQSTEVIYTVSDEAGVDASKSTQTAADPTAAPSNPTNREAQDEAHGDPERDASPSDSSTPAPSEAEAGDSGSSPPQARPPSSGDDASRPSSGSGRSRSGDAGNGPASRGPASRKAPRRTSGSRTPENAGPTGRNGSGGSPSRSRPARTRQAANGRPSAPRQMNVFDDTPQTLEQPADGPTAPDAEAALYQQAEAHLKPDYTFDEFIEGDGNRLARSAAYAVAEAPGSTQYNPLLVYGGVGLGKTHLAQAIANHALQQRTAERILYVSSDRFTSQFVQAVKDNCISTFSRYYRQADLLIVDDVQFFGGKEKTQEEFFHIFNDLHQHGKQIVLCADRPPRDIEGIEQRLLSRFQWGLSADIQRPDLETRIAILQQKATHQNIDVEPQVLELIAQRIDSNIRQLEGALNRLTALAQLGQTPDGTLDLSTARHYLRDQVDDAPTVLDASDIIEQVADYYRLSTDDILSRSRKQAISQARQAAMYLCREMTDQSFSSIGTRFGGRDHSTVIHAHNKVQDRMDTEPNFRQEVKDLKNRIRNRSMSL